MNSNASLYEGTRIILNYVRNLSSSAGVYRMIDIEGNILYVGKAKNLKKRVVSYTKPKNLLVRTQRMISLTHTMEFIITHTEAEALILEVNLIKKLKPRFNILFRDDKSFPYLLLTKNELPSRLCSYRGAKSGAGDYFGPFASKYFIYRTLEILTKVFKLRTCTDSFFKTRTRPCLQYHIKKCTAPCTGKISLEDYGKNVDQAKQFLWGKTKILQTDLASQMQLASENLNYEKAAILRDQIEALTKIQTEQGVYVRSVDEIDVIGVVQLQGRWSVQVFFFRNGANYGNKSFFPKHTAVENDADEYGSVLNAFISWFYIDQPLPKVMLLSHKVTDQDLLEEALFEFSGKKTDIVVPQQGMRFQLVQQALKNAEEALALKLSLDLSTGKLLVGLKDLFNLPTVPKRIEVYDNSHLQGTNAYGTMIVATPDGFEKKSYRIFKIRNVHLHIGGGDDYAMMREVLSRRFANPEPETIPGLILLDGGKGQLSAGTEVMNNLGLSHVPMVAIAKGPDRNAGREKFFMNGKDVKELDPHDPVLYYLQRIRDEAHRFAIGAHRKGREKKIHTSLIEDIEGIGPGRKRILLQHFGSARSVSEAGIADLQKVSGISKRMAQIIYDYFH